MGVSGPLARVSHSPVNYVTETRVDLIVFVTFNFSHQ
jgi:hypothetical protein